MRSAVLSCLVLTLLAPRAPVSSAAEEGVFVRFRLTHPKDTRYWVHLGGYIHVAPWYLPRAVLPPGADNDPKVRLPTGTCTPWFDLRAHAGELLHPRLGRSGGVAELPAVTVELLTEATSQERDVVMELATAADDATVVKRLHERFRGTSTSFLVSRDLAADAASLETASQMTARRLRWARQASGGRRIAPKELIVQTSFWAPQRPELNLREAEVLNLLGFNVVGNQMPEVRECFEFRVPGHTHDVLLGPDATRAQIDEKVKSHRQRDHRDYAPGVPYGLSDEVCARPPIGDSPRALEHFRQWLRRRGVTPEEVGVASLAEVDPIETPDELRRRQHTDDRAARRSFYFTSRFRQEAAVERLEWHTRALHEHFGEAPRSSTLVADHPYFSGTGLGMGIEPNWTWGGHPLAVDWFAIGRTRAVDLIGIEDWMGLQYMYGPDSTWEGFQLMGFQAAIFRSASGGTLPTIAWITPSDETNLRLKSASALAQGARHFFYWTYGPTSTSTENYWSDLRSAYDGVVHVTRQLAAAEPILATGHIRKTGVALLYSISSDLWQPFGYVHMLERRGIYLSLVHDQYLVDLLTEEDVRSGRLANYDVLYVTDPCVAREAAAEIVTWVKRGGHLYGSCGAGSLNEFGEPQEGLARAFGIEPAVEATAQPGRYSVRAGVNAIPYLGRIEYRPPRPGEDAVEIGVIGAHIAFEPSTQGAAITGRLGNGVPAVLEHGYGAGRSIYIGACPGIAYIKEAGFVRDRLAEKWPAPLRAFINGTARRRGVPRLVQLSHPVVEAGVYDAPGGTALVLANFTYERIPSLEISLEIPSPPRRVRSVERGTLEFTLSGPDDPGAPALTLRTVLDLGTSDMVLVE